MALFSPLPRAFFYVFFFISNEIGSLYWLLSYRLNKLGELTVYIYTCTLISNRMPILIPILCVLVKCEKGFEIEKFFSSYRHLEIAVFAINCKMSNVFITGVLGGFLRITSVVCENYACLFLDLYYRRN